MQHRLTKLRLVVAAFVALLTGTGIAHGKCVRYDPTTAKQKYDLDGPGSFGPLQDTVTLDCLKYVRSLHRKGKEHVVIADEKGQTYELSVGDYMGENTGIIRKIDPEFIHGGDNWDKVVVKFPKKSAVGVK